MSPAQAPKAYEYQPSIQIEQSDLAVLRALLTEPTRIAVAVRLECSTRHLRRRLQALLDRLDVPTTHAAIARAVLCGWLTQEDVCAASYSREWTVEDAGETVEARIREVSDC